MDKYCHLAFTLLPVILFAIFVVTIDEQVAAQEDYKCFGLDRAFDKVPNEKYARLFGTKTVYLTARSDIRKRYHAIWPIDESQCRPVYFYLLSRHTIRYPKAAEITELRDFLHPLRNDIVKNGLDARFKELTAWQFQMNETDDNQVSESGKIEAAKTGKLFVYTISSPF